MSVEAPGEGVGIDTLPEPDLDTRTGPRPVAHGASVAAVFNGVDAGDGVPTLYDRVLGTWRDVVGDRDLEPYVLAEVDHEEIDGLRPARDDRRHVFVFESSRWKAGRGDGDDYRAFYKYDLKLREIDDGGELHIPPLSLHLRIEPQYADLVYQDGNAFDPVYGEGSRVTCQTTWAESSEEVETRMVQALRVAFDADPGRLLKLRNDRSRRILKAEAHVRFDIGWKRQVIDALRSSEDLIAFGGASEIESHRKRQREGWLEAVVDADRWHLLGFERNDMNTEVKVYQARGWANIPREKASHHPKLEASFSGVTGNGALPHVDEWDDTLQALREIVSSHLEWSGVGRDELVADDYFDGPQAEAYDYAHPEGRREQLRARYESISTEVYREAMKANTTAVYDVLQALVIGQGGTYDYLEDHTGLARSTIRYHVRRLEERGVVERIGNPTIVVFSTIRILDKAEEILRKVYPDDTAEDRDDRAEERRQRREENDATDDATQDPDADSGDDSASTDGPDPHALADGVWRPFHDLGLEPDQLAKALERDHVDEADVAVRTDPYDWIPDE